ncbi:P-type conjugative transfer ATPase TrbB [Asticcacaulis sp. DW145]|uniref:P-type conjugative transfer ATPase TrbB n=1 Tax=Asticcacaulis sp. DW145 TaxID=3095608 RepID=UPI0030891790|nr:P-type conjugative transfer ATPase TrbB [Asticcacaulis sp. DW145]
MDPLSIPHQRLRAMLRTAMGEGLAAALADPAVFEILVNPDGTVRFDRASEGRVLCDVMMPPAEAERIIRLVASHVRTEIHPDSPIVSAELPMSADGTGGERFEGLLPPVSRGPCFSIRKPAYRLFGLEDYVAACVMTKAQAEVLRRAVCSRQNILVAGSTSSGKTTLTNALLAEVAALGERVVLIEDTRELRCAAEDVVELRTRPGHIAMGDLVRSTLRLRPDRIIVGEVRGAEALDLLKAWNTGHPGGIATLHANSAKGALFRLEQLVQEAVTHVPSALIAEAVDVIVFIRGADPQTGIPRHVAEIVGVQGLDARGGYVLRPMLPLGEDPGTARSTLMEM